MNIALFGGTFDPIHSGHLRAAKAAARRFGLDQVRFVPAAHPPHKQADRLTAFAHRYAMVALACASDARFVPSLLEAPEPGERPQYTIQTVRRARRALGQRDRLFFLIGVDAFLDLPHWKQWRSLLDLADFIVVSRPGSDAGKIWSVLPPGMTLRAPDARSRELASSIQIRLRKSTLRILRGVDMRVASRDIREAIGRGRRISGLVPPVVEQYIRKTSLYTKGGGAGL